MSIGDAAICRNYKDKSEFTLRKPANIIVLKLSYKFSHHHSVRYFNLNIKMPKIFHFQRKSQIKHFNKFRVCLAAENRQQELGERKGLTVLLNICEICKMQVLKNCSSYFVISVWQSMNKLKTFIWLSTHSRH